MHVPIKSDDEVSVKEFFLTLGAYWEYLWQKKWWIITVAMITGVLAGINRFISDDEYSATLTYMINEDDGNGIGGVASILGQFGLGSGGGGEYNLEKILALAKSRRILEYVILDSVEVNGEIDRIGNHIIDELDFHEHWEDDPMKAGYYLPGGEISDSNLLANEVLEALYYLMVGNSNLGLKGMLKLDYDEGSGILSSRISTTNPELSRAIVISHFEFLSQFYINKSIEKQLGTVMILTSRKDSIEKDIYNIESGLARSQDQSLNVLMRQDKLKYERLNRRMQISTILYGEILKNLERASFILDSNTPYFQLIDKPILPIKESPKGTVKQTIIGGFVAGIFMVLFFVIRKAYQDVMK